MQLCSFNTISNDSLTTNEYLHVSLFHNASTRKAEYEILGFPCRQTATKQKGEKTIL